MKSIDFFYVLYVEYMMLVFDVGKLVLCEKVMMLDVFLIEVLFVVVCEWGLFLMEVMWLVIYLGICILLWLLVDGFYGIV